MSLADLKTALTGVGPVDVVDFDMCLMAGYETLVDLQGLARLRGPLRRGRAGRRQSLHPDRRRHSGQSRSQSSRDGDPGRDRFHAFYVNSNAKASTTLSAYDLAGFAAFRAGPGLLSYGPDQRDSPAAAEHREFRGAQPEVHDPRAHRHGQLPRLPERQGDRRPHCRPRSRRSGPGVRDGFRITSRPRNGSGSGQESAADVLRTTGLHPRAAQRPGSDNFNASGPQSLATYQALYPGKPWTAFLASAYTTGGASCRTTSSTRATRPAVRGLPGVGPGRPSPAGADIDSWVLEPDGNIYIPAFGSVSPNGTLSNDSYQDGVNFEGYLTNRVIQQGTYKIYANLWRDPAGSPADLRSGLSFRPERHLRLPAHRRRRSARPRCRSTLHRWINDPTPSLAEAEAGAYSDSFSTSPLPASRWRPGAGATLRRPGIGVASPSRSDGPVMTAAQAGHHPPAACPSGPSRSGSRPRGRSAVRWTFPAEVADADPACRSSWWRRLAGAPSARRWRHSPPPSGSPPPSVTGARGAHQRGAGGPDRRGDRRCLGYSAPTIARGSPPLTRSDWQVEDQGEAVWVSGRLPEGCTSTEPASRPRAASPAGWRRTRLRRSAGLRLSLDAT